MYSIHDHQVMNHIALVKTRNIHATSCMPHLSIEFWVSVIQGYQGCTKVAQQGICLRSSTLIIICFERSFSRCLLLGGILCVKYSLGSTGCGALVLGSFSRRPQVNVVVALMCKPACLVIRRGCHDGKSGWAYCQGFVLFYLVSFRHTYYYVHTPFGNQPVAELCIYRVYRPQCPY